LPVPGEKPVENSAYLKSVWCNSYRKWSETRKCVIAIVFNCALEYSISKVLKIQEGLELNGKCQPLVSALHVYVHRMTVEIAHQKNTGLLLQVGREFGL